MTQVISHACIPIGISIEKVQQEVAQLQQHWLPHFNTQYYAGSWTVLPLRSPGGNHLSAVPDQLENLPYASTPFMKQVPAIAKLVDQLQCEVMAVRLLNLSSGAVIKEHRDFELSFEQGEMRLHFPVFTNPQVYFFVGEQRVIMEAGTCWYINANMPHSVKNEGAEDRIHLVVDCKLNEWLNQQMNEAEKTMATIGAAELLTKKRMVEELRHQGTPVALQLAANIEKELQKFSS